MFVHSVFFWLKEGMTDDEVETFKKGLESLISISSVKSGFFGTPAKTDRPIIDKSYNYGLTIITEDYDSHMEYQVDPIHDKFKEDCRKFFEKVVIYDYD